MNNIVLRAHQVDKTFQDGALKTQVLKQVDLTLQAGEMAAIVGTSGSGKSTLLHLLGGLDQPSSGEVFLNEEPLHLISADELAKLRNRYLGFVYQFHHLLPEFTVFENVALPALIKGDAEDIIKARVDHLLKSIGLSHRAEHKPSELSGGERQRVAIARSLINRPLCVLMDEPTGNLDRQTANDVMQLIFELNREFNTAFLLVTHDEHWAKQMHRVLRMSDGRLV